MNSKYVVIIIWILVCSTTIVGQTTLTIQDGVGIQNETMSVPIFLTNDASQDIYSILVEVEFELEHLDFIGHSSLDSISDSLTIVFNGLNGKIFISIAGVHPVKESGELVYLNFIPTILGFTSLKIDTYRINEDEGIEPDEVANYKIFATGGNQPPFSLNIPDTLTFESTDTLDFLIDETVFSDLEDTFNDLTITATVIPEVVIASFDSTTNILEVTTADYVGFATLFLMVEDLDGGVFEDSIILNIKMKVSNEETTSTPARFVLDQNYPNPFNPSTNISYHLPQSGNILLEVFSMNGQKVATLVDGVQSTGSHTVRFDASSVSSGIYLYRISSGSFSDTKKMLLIK